MKILSLTSFFRNRRQIAIASGLGLVVLSSCTPSGDPIAKTSCTQAIAEATYTWRVNYWTSRTGGPNAQRWEEFDSTSLTTFNAKKPEGAVTGPDDNEVWYPALPKRPTPDEMDERREPGESQDPPEMLTTVNYSLDCADGKLKADKNIYRQVAKAVKASESANVNYTLGRAINLAQ